MTSPSSPWLDASLPSAERARLLAAAMTPAEQAGQLLNYDGGKPIDWLAERHVGSFLNRKGPVLVELARELRARHRLQVPVLFALDCAHGHALSEDLGGTIFPVPLAMAATFDPAHARAMGRVTADEMIATGIRWIYGPNIDVVRDLRFGRVEEMFGEDPYLVGEIGAACIEGLQGPDPARPRVLACAKHLTGYSEGIGARDSAECPVSWRVLRRDHLPPYRRAIQAGVRSVMSGYHAIDGTPCVINRRLLRDELRRELGFTGFVVSDANNVRWCTLLNALAGTHDEFIVRCLEAGNEIHLAATGVVEALVAAVESGRLDPAILRDAAALFLEAKFALGLFEQPEPLPLVQVRTAASYRAAADAAAASMVLLENHHGALPLGRTPQRIALVGKLADDLAQQFGCWSLTCRNPEPQLELAKQPESASWTYLAALRARAAAAGSTLTYTPGCGPAPGT
ncbi:MAG: glycoside hydrolase family 3 protein, partial [Burkholderiales bacterium]|nr:glycoside hydrolase family 3 protein [Opitutaceae bacterium]